MSACLCLAEALSDAKDMAKDMAKEARGLAKGGLHAVATEAKKGSQGLSRAVETLARPAKSLGKKVKEGATARDRPLGRLVLELRLLRPGHTYDGWLPLELRAGEYRGRGRGFVRVRYSLTWAAPLPMLRRALRTPALHALGFGSRLVQYYHTAPAY